MYQLPAVEIPWWNTQTRQMEITRIPATTLTTMGSVSSQGSTPVQSSPTTAPVATQLQSDDSIAQNSIWFWLSIIFGLCWLITLLLWYVSRQKNVPEESSQAQTNNFTIKTLQQACRNNDPVAAKDALLHWGQQQWQLSSLGEIAGRCESELQQSILALNKTLYSQQATEWQGDQLLQSFKNQSSQAAFDNDKVHQQHLQPLYKA